MSRTGIARVDFYFDDWLTGTFELTPELRGAFITICALIWKTRNRLADNDDAVARWVGVKPRKWRELKAALVEAGKVAIEGGFIRQNRAAEELETAVKRYETAQERGQKGHRKRTHNASLQNDKPLEIQETDPACSSSTNTNTYSKKKESLTPETPTLAPNVRQLFPDPPASRPSGASAASPARSSGKPDGDFDRFWSAYPRKVGKGQARTVWARAVRQASGPEPIIAGLELARRRWADDGTDPQFIPHPRTWLTGERWADEPLPLVPQRRAVADYRDRYPDIPG